MVRVDGPTIASSDIAAVVLPRGELAEPGQNGSRPHEAAALSAFVWGEQLPGRGQAATRSESGVAMINPPSGPSWLLFGARAPGCSRANTAVRLLRIHHLVAVGIEELEVVDTEIVASRSDAKYQVLKRTRIETLSTDGL